MRLSHTITDTLELSKNLLPYREKLRGQLGEQILLSLKPAETLEQLRKREALLREWLDLTDHNGQFRFSAGLESVTHMFTQARRSGILSGEELLKVRAVLQCARHIREDLAKLSDGYTNIEDLRHGIGAETYRPASRPEAPRGLGHREHAAGTVAVMEGRKILDACASGIHQQVPGARRRTFGLG